MKVLPARLPLPAALLLALLGAAVPAHATEYWTLTKLLGEFFAGSEHVTFKPVTLSDADAAAIEKKLGAPVKRSWSVYFGTVGDRRTGYAIRDAEIGLHEPIDFGVRFGLGGGVERVEIMAYREPYGDEIRQDRYRRQFVGKTAADPITAGKDIDIISGATYSSRSVALGVKRDTLVLDAALKNGL
jgi:electron transport complex protein RnfG